jgi:hypothetical protein
MNRRNILMRVAPLGANGPEVKYLSSAAASGSGVYLDGKEWLPCIDEWPTLDVSFVQDGVLEEMTIKHGDLTFRMAPAYRNEAWSALDWSHAEASIYMGNVGDAFADYQQTYQGAVSSIDRTGITATISLLGPEAQLDKPLLTLSYLGTGNAEGPEARSGTLKPWCSGNALSVAPTLVDSAYWVYQVHGYGPVEDIPIAYEFAQALAPAVASVATYAELIALPLTPGQWAKCLPLGMMRLGGAPNKKVSCDVRGATVGAQYANSLSAIVGHLLTHGGVPADRIGNLNQFAGVPWNFFAAEQITVGEVVRDALRQAGGYLLPDGAGVWQVGDYQRPKPAKQLRQDRSAKPLVVEIASPPEAAPVYKVTVGYDRCWALHGSGDVADTTGEAVRQVTEVATGANNNANAIRTNLPSLVGPLLQTPVDTLSALMFRSNGTILKASSALAKENLVAVRTLETKVDENGEKVARDTLQLTSRLDAADVAALGLKGQIEAGLLNVNETIVNKNEALSRAFTAQIARFGEQVSSAITVEQLARTTKDDAITLDLTNMETRFTNKLRDDLAGFSTDLTQLILDNNGAVALDIKAMGTKYDRLIGDETLAREAVIRTINETIATDKEAITLRIDTMSSDFDKLVGDTVVNITATIDNLSRTQTDATGAVAEDVRKLTAKVGEDYSTIEQRMLVFVKTEDLNDRFADTVDGINATIADKTREFGGFDGRLNAFSDNLTGIGSQYVLKLGYEQNGTKVFGGFGIATQNGYVDAAFATDSFRIMLPGVGGRQVFYVDQDGLKLERALIGKITAGELEVTNASIQNLTISGDKFEPSAVTSVGSFERDYGGWRVTDTTGLRFVGGAENPVGTTVRTGNSATKVIINCTGIWERDGSDDDNLDISLQRYGGNSGEAYFLSTKSNVQVFSGRRTFSFAWVDENVDNNTDYTYRFMQKSLRDGSPYYHNVTFYATSHKK